jgi:hypothetical protein
VGAFISFLPPFGAKQPEKTFPKNAKKTRDCYIVSPFVFEFYNKYDILYSDEDWMYRNY